MQRDRGAVVYDRTFYDVAVRGMIVDKEVQPAKAHIIR